MASLTLGWLVTFTLFSSEGIAATRALGGPIELETQLAQELHAMRWISLPRLAVRLDELTVIDSDEFDFLRSVSYEN
ncbi:hypothetical protein Q9L58_004939 [Maublancomyces gigas]|uniref:Uncharacterized protein n=1 Tax=Discina gigas TaxID=1032678 RepID=A0ABR3GJL2_9PEZI